VLLLQINIIENIFISSNSLHAESLLAKVIYENQYEGFKNLVTPEPHLKSIKSNSLREKPTDPLAQQWVPFFSIFT
jgi:hypothetical protein